MKKETVRPILVQNLEELKVVELSAELQVQAMRAETPAPGTAQLWAAAGIIQDRWAEARLKRAVAELQLWLADRQWEREEQEERRNQLPPEAEAEIQALISVLPTSKG